MICYDVDTALAEVPVNSVGLTDDTDFKTLETAVAYNASGMALYWHFITPAGAYTCTAVTPTTAGTYDWAHQQQGMYTIEIPASGGASINNDTEGFGYFTGFATGVLPWRGPTVCFRAAALNDALVEGGDLLDVSVTQFGGTNGTFSGGRAEVNTSHIAGSAVSTSTAQLGVNVVNFGGSAGTFASGRPEVNASHIAGSSVSTSTAQLGVNVVNFGGSAGTFASGRPEVNSSHWGGTAVASATPNVNIAQISGDSVAADNAESFFDGTGYAGTNNVIPSVTTVTTTTTATNLTNAPTSGDLTATMKASVNAEVLDVLNTDTFSEPGQGTPAATTSLAAKINYLYKAWRNKKTQTATTYSLFADDATTVDQKSTVSGDGTTTTVGEIATGP